MGAFEGLFDGAALGNLENVVGACENDGLSEGLVVGRAVGVCDGQFEGLVVVGDIEDADGW